MFLNRFSTKSTINRFVSNDNVVSEISDLQFRILNEDFKIFKIKKDKIYEGRSESKERFAIQIYLSIIGKKQNMQVLSHTFTYIST
jgi:hypothetical protein